MLLPLLEYVFKITTDISLLELLDLNQPLMKSLMITAPGTYHHSVIVGNLVEAAAEAVGVNPLLARVSSYYHDIGKIKMPEYFVENQSNAPSKHDKLTPHMSSMIIINHVKEGVELAKQYKLPQSIIDIIRQHHGDALITYFYQKAKEQNQENLNRMDEYKYPGPKAADPRCSACYDGGCRRGLLQGPQRPYPGQDCGPGGQDNQPHIP